MIFTKIIRGFISAKRVLLPISSAMDIPTVPAELFTKFQVSFYSEPVDAVYKALDVN